MSASNPRYNEKVERNTEMFDLWQKGSTQAEIAKKYDVSPGTVNRIIKRILKETFPDHSDQVVKSKFNPRFFQGLALFRELSEKGEMS